MYRPIRFLTALLCSVLVAPAAHAAGLKVSLTERAHWPWPMATPQAFDVASRAELAVLARRKATSVEQLRALYAGMCVASHGQEHRSHATWAGAVAGMESFHSRLAETLPEGQPKLTLFRPPYGQRNPDILQALARGGMKNMLWNIDSQDWHSSNSGSKAAGRVLSLMLLWRHDIILFHDVHPKATSALPRIWRETRGSGVSWADCRSQ